MDWLLNIFSPFTLQRIKGIANSKYTAMRVKKSTDFKYNIFDSLPDGIIIFNKHKKIIAMNKTACEYFHIKSCGLNMDVLSDLFKKLINSIVENLNFNFGVYEELYDAKLDRHYNIKVSEIKFGDEKDFLLIFSDITLETKLRRQRLIHEKLNAVSNLAANLAHEIRNPLAVIYGSVQLMALKPKSKNMESYAKWILEELEQINIVISELLTLTKLDSPSLKLSNMKDMFSEIRHNIIKYSKPAQVKIIWDISEKLPLIKVDTVQMKIVFLNLVKNAIETMPDGGTLCIKAYYHNDNKIAVSFIDNGIAIKEEMLNEIFNGNGLGLATCKIIVENHGGKIEIKSKQNKGNCFTVILPVTDELY